MRNASVASLIYEFLFKVYEKREIERADWSEIIPDDEGIEREAHCHEFMSCWEWSFGVLEDAGVLKRLPLPPSVLEEKLERSTKIDSAYFYPRVTLDECRDMNFSAFETFDNYCYAMFTFDQFIYDYGTDVRRWSPRFLEVIVSQDDIFSGDGKDWVDFDRERFDEKVMVRWNEMEVRRFAPKESC